MPNDDSPINFPKELMNYISSQSSKGDSASGYIFCELKDNESLPFYIALRTRNNENSACSQKNFGRDYRQTHVEIIKEFLMENSTIELMTLKINPSLPQIKDPYHPFRPSDEALATMIELYNIIGSRCRDHFYSFKEVKPFLYRCHNSGVIQLKNDCKTQIEFIKRTDGIMVDNAEERGKDLEEKLFGKFSEKLNEEMFKSDIFS